MSVDKLVDSAQLDADLTSVADAIRAKGGASGQLAFPADFVTAIGNISGGGSGDVYEWFGAKNATLLHTANYSIAFKDLDGWSSLSPTTSQQYIKYPATTYTATASNNVQYDRYGDGYNGGEKMYFHGCGYVVVCEALSDIRYTSDEETLGVYHSLGRAYSGLYLYAPKPYLSNEQIVYPTDSSAPYYAAANFSSEVNYGRNASNKLTTIGNYGVFLNSAPGVSIGSGGGGGSDYYVNYFAFLTPTANYRYHNTYFPQSVFSLIDADNSTIKVRHKLYRVDADYYFRALAIRSTNAIINRAFDN